MFLCDYYLFIKPPLKGRKCSPRGRQRFRQLLLLRRARRGGASTPGSTLGAERSARTGLSTDLVHHPTETPHPPQGQVTEAAWRRRGRERGAPLSHWGCFINNGRRAWASRPCQPLPRPRALRTGSPHHPGRSHRPRTSVSLHPGGPLLVEQVEGAVWAWSVWGFRLGDGTTRDAFHVQQEKYCNEIR